MGAEDLGPGGEKRPALGVAGDNGPNSIIAAAYPEIQQSLGDFYESTIRHIMDSRGVTRDEATEDLAALIARTFKGER